MVGCELMRVTLTLIAVDMVPPQESILEMAVNVIVSMAYMATLVSFRILVIVINCVFFIE